MGKILLMSPELANLIAAGEVIERPASVVKELVENSIDAESKNIFIGIVDAGKKTIIVKDDGCGMNKEDAKMAFLRHASSKVKSEFDLQHIHTLGFRGEAIPSIASVSNVILTTSDGIDKGTKIISKPYKELEVCSAPSRKGTIFEINNLFMNVPARLKYLKSDKTETYSIIEVVEKMALSFPHISFTLSIDGRVLFKTSGSGKLLETIQLIYGVNIAKNLYYFEDEETTFKISGYISKPEINYSRKSNLNIFLNNRYIYNYTLLKAISEGYKDYLPPEKYPFVIINLEIDPAAVDVNVHPSKKEVRMSLESEISFSIKKNIYNLLTDKKPIYEVKSDLKTNKEETKDIGINNLRKKEDNQETLSFPISFDNKNIQDIKEEDIKEEKEEIKIDNDNDITYSYNSIFNLQDYNKSFPELYPIGQVLQTYIVCDSKDGFYLIDQHAANERINYEKTELLFKNEKSRIIPLIPIIVTLSYKEMINLDSNHLKMLEDLGFIIEKFGEKEVKVNEIPSFLIYDENSIIEDVIHSCLSDEKVSLTSLLHLTIADIACKKSIKANHIMSKSEIDGLIRDLARCNNPANCPHGRPTLLKLTKEDIEKIFRRSGF